MNIILYLWDSIQQNQACKVIIFPGKNFYAISRGSAWNEAIVRELEQYSANGRVGNENARSIARKSARLRAIDLAFSFPVLSFAQLHSNSRTITSLLLNKTIACPF